MGRSFFGPTLLFRAEQLHSAINAKGKLELMVQDREQQLVEAEEENDALQEDLR